MDKNKIELSITNEKNRRQEIMCSLEKINQEIENINIEYKNKITELTDTHTKLTNALKSAETFICDMENLLTKCE